MTKWLEFLPAVLYLGIYSGPLKMGGGCIKYSQGAEFSLQNNSFLVLMCEWGREVPDLHIPGSVLPHEKIKKSDLKVTET